MSYVTCCKRHWVCGCASKTCKQILLLKCYSDDLKIHLTQNAIIPSQTYISGSTLLSTVVYAVNTLRQLFIIVFVLLNNDIFETFATRVCVEYKRF